MSTSTGNDDVFAGDLHGFLIYPASYARPHGEEFTPLRVLKQAHAREHGVQLGGPVQMELPKPFGGAVFSSSYARPDPLSHEQAVAQLHDKPHRDFLMMADDATRRYLNLGHDAADQFTHLHGIGSWENQVEPSMMTVFHRPVDGLQLQRIGADIGSWARQHGILAFSPHPGGAEQLLHMRLRTHPEMRRLTQPVLVRVSQQIHDEFNKYFDPAENGGQSFWIPGRTILPSPTGHTDVLTWVPPWEKDKDRVHRAFSEIGNKLGAVRPPTFWSGTGLLLGGTSPYSDEEAAFLSDAQKRDAAVANYQQALTNPEPMVHESVPVVSEAIIGNPAARRQGRRVVSLRDFLGRYKTRLARSPAKTGAVVRGVYYAPGKMMPDVIQASAEPPAGESVLARIRKRFKKNKHHSTLTEVNQGSSIGAVALMRRPPMRLSADTVGMHRAIAAAPSETGHWGVLADALDEAYKPHTAHLLRGFMGSTPEAGVWLEHPHPVRDNLPSEESTGPLRYGTVVRGAVAGVPFSLYRKHRRWEFNVDSPAAGGQELASGEIGHPTAVELIHEMDGPHWGVSTPHTMGEQLAGGRWYGIGWGGGLRETITTAADYATQQEAVDAVHRQVTTSPPEAYTILNHLQAKILFPKGT